MAKRYRKPRKDILKQFIDNFRTKILEEISQAEKRHFTISNCQFWDEDIKIVITSQRGSCNADISSRKHPPKSTIKNDYELTLTVLAKNLHYENQEKVRHHSVTA